MVDIRVIVPHYNCPDLLAECLASIAAQDYIDRGGFFEVVVVDDGSPCGMEAVQAAFECMPKPPRPRFHWGLTGRLERGGELASIIEGTRALVRENGRPHAGIPPLTAQSVIAHVCADDMLSDPGALSRLAEAYEDPQVWMTYGQYRCIPGGEVGHCAPLPPESHELGDYRKRPWMTSHLRSYRKGLWDKVPTKKYLIDPQTGEPWFLGTDLACVFPMLELARERAKFIPEVLYLYRQYDGNVTPEQYMDCCDRVRALPPMARIDSL